MLGEDEELKKLKKRMQAAGCDMDVVKKWQKQLHAVKKQYASVYGAYEMAYESLRDVDSCMKDLEKMLSSSDGTWDRFAIRQIQDICKILKRIKNAYDHEFVVSKSDAEFHLISETIRRLGEKFDGSGEQKILLQSEVENLRALISEKLKRNKPDGVQLTFFYMGHRDEELAELPPESRLELIQNVFEQEFLMLMLGEIKRLQDYTEEELKALVTRIAGA